MAILYLQGIRCIQPLNPEGDQVTLNTNYGFFWSSPSLMTAGSDLPVTDKPIPFGSNVQIQLSTNDIDLDNLCVIGANTFFNQFVSQERCQSRFIAFLTQEQCQFGANQNSNYILYYQVDPNLPVFALVLYVLAQAVFLVAIFLFRVIDVFIYLAQSTTQRYQLQSRPNIPDATKVE